MNSETIPDKKTTQMNPKVASIVPTRLYERELIYKIFGHAVGLFAIFLV